MPENPDDQTPEFSEKIQSDSESFPNDPDQVSEANDSEFDDDDDDTIDEDEAAEEK